MNNPYSNKTKEDIVKEVNKAISRSINDLEIALDHFNDINKDCDDFIDTMYEKLINAGCLVHPVGSDDRRASAIKMLDDLIERLDSAIDRIAD